MITLKNVSFSVTDNKNDTNKTIINEFNYQFKPNKITVITGHNGSGKSTLIKLIMGINNVTDGQILLGDTDITNLSVTDRANMRPQAASPSR